MKNLGIFFIIIFFCSNPTFGQTSVSEYQESVQLLLPTIDINEENIFFKAFVYSSFFSESEVASGVLYVQLKNSNNEVVKTQYHAIRKGVVNGNILLDKRLSAGTYTIEAYTRWMLNYKNAAIGKTSFCLKCDPEQKNNSVIEPVVTIEGGNIIQDIPAKVIVRNQVESHKIVDKQGNYITGFNKTGFGYSAALFTPVLGTEYYYLRENEKVQLPEVMNTGYVLRVNNLDENILKLNVETNSLSNSKGLKLIAYYKGFEVLRQNLKFKNKVKLSLELNRKDFYKGLYKFYLIDDDNIIQSYRPVNINQETLDFTTEIVSSNDGLKQLKLKVANDNIDEINVPISLAISKGNTGLAALNRASQSKEERFRQDIYALVANPSKTLTRIKSALLNDNNYPIQLGLDIVGKAYGLDDKILRDEKIEILASSDYGVLIENIETNEDAILELRNVNLLGENQIIFRKKGDNPYSRMVKLVPLDKKESQSKNDVIASTNIEEIKVQKEREKQSTPFNTKDAVALKTVALEGSVVKKRKTTPSTYGVEAIDSRTNFQDIDKPKTLPELFQNISGVVVANADFLNPSIRIPSATGTALIVIDGFPLAKRATNDQRVGASTTLGGNTVTSLRPILDIVNVSDIERVEVLLGSEAAIYGSRAAGGVIQVYTRNGSIDKFTPRKEAAITFQGYEPQISFDTYWEELSRSKKKNTTLLYWNPSIELDDKGEAIIQIPNNNYDGPKTISIGIDGNESFRSNLRLNE